MSFDRLTLNVAFCVALISLVVLPGSATGQDTNEADVHTPTPHLPSTSTLPRDYPVITLLGVCPAATKPPAACKTVVTRAEFERLVESINPAMPKYERRQLADNYAQTLTLADQAIKRGMDKDWRVQEKLRYTRLRVLAGEMATKIYDQSTEIPSSEAQHYYQENKETFRRFNLQRIFIPKEMQGSGQSKDPAKDAAELHSLAENIHTRAAAGEDFAKLQKEVATEAGITGEVSVDISDMSRRGLPEEHQQVLQLDPGKTSSLITDDSGYYIYRMVSNGIPEFEKVRKQVLVEIQSHKQAQALNKIQQVAKTEVNETYFQKYDPPAAKESESEVEED